ncbi:response regulator [Calothrix sp. UHCC 0171]|uniref:response regulator n=1 Tax=Calothrix sp. UHCC 0171 TaxID=3110245 RepID=UPI002B2082F2|nr:response regulator [Calothrix sp. UHCC 0171]MEA5573736.1 response regulator [Calothrix sp. UHCC 0171]
MTAQLLQSNPLSDSSPQTRLLLIEDNDINRMFLSDYLSYFRYDVKSLPDASDVFATLDNFQPHLILLDLKLPETDGYLVLKQIKQKSIYAQIPVIIVSAFAFKTDQERAIELGACHYFVKPVNLEQLVQTIAEVLAKST